MVTYSVYDTIITYSFNQFALLRNSPFHHRDTSISSIPCFFGGFWPSRRIGSAVVGGIVFSSRSSAQEQFCCRSFCSPWLEVVGFFVLFFVCSIGVPEPFPTRRVCFGWLWL